MHCNDCSQAGERDALEHKEMVARVEEEFRKKMDNGVRPLVLLNLDRGQPDHEEMGKSTRAHTTKEEREMLVALAKKIKTVSTKACM